MTTQAVTINVDIDTARSFATAPPEERRKVELLLGLRLRELVQGPVRPLREIMDEVVAEAEAKGLTAETLESLLRDE